MKCQRNGESGTLAGPPSLFLGGVEHHLLHKLAFELDGIQGGANFSDGKADCGKDREAPNKEENGCGNDQARTECAESQGKGTQDEERDGSEEKGEGGLEQFCPMQDATGLSLEHADDRLFMFIGEFMGGITAGAVEVLLILQAFTLEHA